MNSGITAYIPCYNNAPTIRQAIESIRNQSVAPAELFVVDDASTDGSPELVRALGIPVVEHGHNSGRGAVRARAMTLARHELVLCCDAINVLDSEFVARAQPQFAHAQAAGVFGRIITLSPRHVVDRWCSRHLFKLDQPATPSRRALLATGGAIVRAAAVRAVGNYRPDLRHSEDSDLGHRLLAAGYDVIYDPQLTFTCITPNTLGRVLERYWRWYAGPDERVSWTGYLRQVLFSIKIMAAQDLRAHDPLSVPISLFSPHYQFWRSWLRRLRRQGPP